MSIHNAKWIFCPQEYAAPVIHRTWSLQAPCAGTISITALGYFTLYINGIRVSDELFRPSVSLYHERNGESWIYPIHDQFTYRCYYSTYDITSCLKSGTNTMEILLGNGWYRQTERTAEGDMHFGEELGALYAMTLSDAAGERWILSDGTEICHPSATVYSQLFYGEIYDARLEHPIPETSPVHIKNLPDTLLTPETAPADRVIRRITPVLLAEDGDRKLYDAGENISGYAVVQTVAAEGESVRIRYAENLCDHALDFHSAGSDYTSPDGRNQIMEDLYIGDGKEHCFRPRFVWHAFRYFEITGPGTAPIVEVIHSDTPERVCFHSSSAELNWLFEAYLRTQTNNMHGGIPSDCPHRERLGYTGDGQACAPAAMLMLDSQMFYKKWIQDIFDSQDADTGHVNHTAPFMGGGGGPGGWGCAAVLVPYYYYRSYGDASVITAYYDRMLSWIHYLHNHSENGLVVREEEGGWCLGDWCTLEATTIPEAFVNTCYYIRSLRLLKEMADVIHKTEDISKFNTFLQEAEKGLTAAYYDPQSHSYAGSIQGADAFALWAGLGDMQTYRNLQTKYDNLGHFDTGFLCTDILCGLLFEHGGENTAFKLLTSHDPGSFGWMMDHDATTIWETWLGDVSHDHPMFGAAARFLISDILGIRQTAGSAGYQELLIAPKTPEALLSANGSLTLPDGTVSVSWNRRTSDICFQITLPENRSCDFQYQDFLKHLSPGTHEIHIPIGASS